MCTCFRYKYATQIRVQAHAGESRGATGERPVDNMALMEVGHGVADAYGDLDALPVSEALVFLMEVIEQVAVAVHDLLHQIEGPVLHAYTQQLDDARVLERPHHLAL